MANLMASKSMHDLDKRHLGDREDEHDFYYGNKSPLTPGGSPAKKFHFWFPSTQCLVEHVRKGIVLQVLILLQARPQEAPVGSAGPSARKSTLTLTLEVYSHQGPLTPTRFDT